MDWLAEQLHALFEEEARTHFDEPWQARNRYGQYQATRFGDRKDATGAGSLAPRARELLEMERNALRMFTSCGWFFDDLAGIEAVQVLRYAARAIELAGVEAGGLEAGFLEHLEEAVTNEEPARNGRGLFLEEVEPPVPAALRVAGGHAALRTLGEDPAGRVEGFESEDDETRRPSTAGVRVTHRRTGRQWQVPVRIHRPRLGLLRVEILADETDHGSLSLEMGDLPEGYRIPAEAILKTAIISRWIPRSRREQLLLGQETLPLVTGTALLRALRALSEDPSDRCFTRVVDLTDLLGLLREPIPFDVQTEFHRIRREASPGLARRLAELAEPLGCVTT
jgi:hypothetical protein